MRAPSFASPGMTSIEIATALISVVARRAIDEASGQRDADHHEAELAARPEQQRHFGGGARAQTERRVRAQKARAP